MKKILLSTLMMGLLALINVNVSAQVTWDDVIEETKGDTVVVKSFLDWSGIEGLNSLFVAVLGDTNTDGSRKNPNRVYETKVNGIYQSDGTLELDNAGVELLKIVAKPVDPKGSDRPPLHIKTTDATGKLDKTFFQTPGSIYMSNQYFALVLTNNTFDRELTRAQETGGSYVYENCIFEFTNWVQHFPQRENQTFKFKDCKFINLGWEASLERGLPFDHWIPVDTLWFENNTVFNAGGVTHGRSNNNCGPRFAYFNHNTFVNTTLPPFLFYTQAEMVVTNNLIVNSGLTPDFPGYYTNTDDPDSLPKGTINIAPIDTSWINLTFKDGGGYPGDDTTETDLAARLAKLEAARKMLVHNNNVYWDPAFMIMFNNLPPVPDSTSEFEWAHQYMLMNERTKTMFGNSTDYPYLNEGTNSSDKVDFAEDGDLVADWVTYISDNAIPWAPASGGGFIPRFLTRDTATLYLPEWPMAADLSYTTASLLTAGNNSMPLGDLNWFPAKKADWEAKSESDTMIAALMSGKLPPDSWGGSGSSIFNPKSETINVTVAPNPIVNSAKVTYTLTEGASVDVVVYNLLGEQVMVDNLGYRAQDENEYILNCEELSSGMYILHINTSDSQTGLATKISVK